MDTEIQIPLRCNETSRVKDSSSPTRSLILAIVLCTVFMIAELIGGYISGSLAIMTDAVHLLSDVAGFLVSLFSITWSKRPKNDSMSFGYHRTEILGALISISFVWAMTFYLLWEAVVRMRNPREINGEVMFVTSALGVVINVIIGFVLHSGHSHSHADHIGSGGEEAAERQDDNINIRASLIHVFGDLVQSVGVMAAAIIIWYKPGWVLADPLCTFLFSAIVVATTYGIAKETIMVLMEGTPESIDPQSIKNSLKNLPDVLDVHDLHVWSLATGRYSASLHVVVNFESIKIDRDYKQLLISCQEVVCQHGIHHATIQLDPQGLLDFHCQDECFPARN